MIKDKLTREATESAANCPDDKTVGLSLPEAVIGGSLYALSDGSGQLWHVLGSMQGTHVINISNSTEGSSTNIAGNYLYAEEAYAIDSKLDDGKPLTGTVKVIQAYTNVANPSGNSQTYGKFVVDAQDNATNCTYNSEYIYR